VPLNEYPAEDGDPAAWLTARWQREWPGLPPLPRLLADGGVWLLLDALNEVKRGPGQTAAARMEL